MSQLGTLTSALLVPGHRQGCVTAPIRDYKAWHGFGWDHLAFSQLLPLVREKQLCSRHCSWFLLLLSCFGEWERSQRDIGCALQSSSFNCPLAHFISQHRYSHLACICGLCLSAGTEVTYFKTGWWRKKRKHDMKCGWVLCDPEPSPASRLGICFHEGTWFSAHAVSAQSRDRPQHVTL